MKSNPGVKNYYRQREGFPIWMILDSNQFILSQCPKQDAILGHHSFIILSIILSNFIPTSYNKSFIFYQHV